jgi:hypothetical protein
MVRAKTVTINQASATATTEIHSGNNHATDVQGTSLDLDSTVHDKAIVTGNGTTDVTGTVDFTFFKNGTCTPGTNNVNVVATDNNKALTAGSPATLDNTTFARGPLKAGTYSFLVHYDGDTNYSADDAPCETVTIQPGLLATATIPRSTAATTTRPTSRAPSLDLDFGTVHDHGDREPANGTEPTSPARWTSPSSRKRDLHPGATNKRETLVRPRDKQSRHSHAGSGPSPATLDNTTCAQGPLQGRLLLVFPRALRRGHQPTRPMTTPCATVTINQASGDRQHDRDPQAATDHATDVQGTSLGTSTPPCTTRTES